jgi:energy-coupling factor transporter ATP-binding protein EcfA2
MRISSIELKNIRCFEHIAIDLGSDGSPAPWAVVLGDNGTGKSTLLRCIALGLAPTTLAASMIVEAGGEWVRTGAKHGTISITLETGEKRELSIHRESDGEHIVDHRKSFSDALRDRIFVCGYGAARRSFGDRSFQSYSVRDAVSTLFNYDAELQNPELILRRIGDQNGGNTEVLGWIDNVLMLPRGSTRLGKSGLEVRGPWGDFTPVGSLGDGFRATLAWILDFLGWVMFRDYEMLHTGISGIVLVDEIEQHLHPQWQRRILGLLRRQFPEVQFIVTTHSSLCVIGTTDFADEDVSLIHLRQRDLSVGAISGLRPPRGLRADQVLTSYLFGLETTSDDQTKFEIERLSKLLSRQQRTPDEEAEVMRLREALGQKLGSEETELGRRVSRAAQTVVASEVERRLDPAQQLDAATPTAEQPVDLEVKRQFQELIAKL